MGNKIQDRDEQRIGSVLAGQYRLEALLGRGGMGSVYRALQLSVNRPVAIKLISAASSQQREGLLRFRREADALAKLRHPNTVRMFDFGSLGEDELFMVMELLDGCDLSQRMSREGALSAAEALGIVRDALGSLGEAHAHGIVHRDIKPANIFLARQHDGSLSAKLMDFGVASIKHGAGSSKLTLTGELLGTPTYMAPEQAIGKPADARSDLYSLGVTLFQMLTGRAPFETESAASLLLAHVRSPVPRLENVAPGLGSGELQALIDALLHKDPERRPPSAADAQRRVEALLRAQYAREPGLAVGREPALVSAREPGLAAAREPALAVGREPALAAGREPAVAARPVSTSKNVPSRRLRAWRLESERPYLWLLAGLAMPVVAWLAYSAAVARVESSTQASVLAATDARPREPGEYAAASEPPRSGSTFTAVPLAAAEPPRSAIQQLIQAARGATQDMTQPASSSTEGLTQPAAAPALTVLLRSSPGQARVFQGDRELGKTPYSVQVDSPTRFTLKLAGYTPYDLELSTASKPDVTVRLSPLAAAVPVPGAPGSAYAAPEPSPLQVLLQVMPRHSRQQAMLLNGPPYANVSLSKRAYQRGAIDGALYDDIIWALKVRRKERLSVEKANYKNGMISRDEYDRRVRQIDYLFEGE